MRTSFLTKLLSITVLIFLNSIESEQKKSEPQENNYPYQFHENYGLYKGIPPSISSHEPLGLSCSLRLSYGKEKAIHILDERDGLTMRNLQQLLKIPYEEIASLDFLDQFTYTQEGQDYMLIFTMQYLFYLNSTSKKLVWYLSAKSIKAYEVDQEKISLKIFDQKVRIVNSSLNLIDGERKILFNS